VPDISALFSVANCSPRATGSSPSSTTSALASPLDAPLLGVVVPIAYVLKAPPDHGGYNFEYSLDLIWAHWIGVAAIVLLMMACWRTLAAARRDPLRSAVFAMDAVSARRRCG